MSTTPTVRRRERVPRLAVGGSGVLSAKRSFRSSNPSHGNNGQNVAAVASGQSVLRGYLWKRGGGRSALGNKDWKQRWCVLVDGHFCYYESQEAWKKAPGKCLKKPYRLVDCDVLPGEHDNDFDTESSKVKLKSSKTSLTTSYAFRIQPRDESERSMILRCCDREQRSMWMEQISMSVHYTDADLSMTSNASTSSMDRRSISIAHDLTPERRGSSMGVTSDWESTPGSESFSKSRRSSGLIDRRKSSLAALPLDGVGGGGGSGPLTNAQMSNIENYLQLANDFQQHEGMRKEDVMTDLIAHLKSSDRTVRLTAIRTLLRLARNRQNIAAIASQEGVEALLFMISNTYPLIERQTVACAFQTLRVLMLDQEVNCRLWESNIDRVVVSLAMEFKSGTVDLFDNLLMFLCDMVEMRMLLQDQPPWSPSTDIYDTFLFAIINCGQDLVRAEGFIALTGLLCTRTQNAWACFHDGDTNCIITACAEAFSSTNHKLVSAAIDFLLCAIASVGEPLFRKLQSVFEFVAPELDRLLDGKEAPVFSTRLSKRSAGSASERPRDQSEPLAERYRSDELQKQACQLQEAYQRLTTRMKATAEDKWHFTGPSGTAELLSMMVPVAAE